MLEGLKAHWQQFRSAPTGQRFQMRFLQRQKKPRRQWQKYAAITGGIILMAAGLLLMAMPGPGVLVLGIGAALIAQESRYAAKTLDAIEPPAQRIARRSLRLWREASTCARVAAISVTVLIAGLAALGAYRVIFQ